MAKNTLDKKPVFCPKNGATLLAETKVTGYSTDNWWWQIAKRPCLSKRFAKAIGWRCNQRIKGSIKSPPTNCAVSLSLGSQNCCLSSAIKQYAHISPYLGKRIYTNAESLLGVRFLDDQHGAMSDGVAIGSAGFIWAMAHWGDALSWKVLILRHFWRR